MYNDGKGKGKAVPLHTMKVYRASRCVALFLTLALNGGGWLNSHPGCFNPNTHCVADWMGPRASLDNFRRKSLAPAGI